jgi:hypothetical protein
MNITTIILEQLRSLGWKVTSHRLDHAIEFHAVLVTDPDQFHVARCNDGAGPDEEYRAACLLADACGVALEDG